MANSPLVAICDRVAHPCSKASLSQQTRLSMAEKLLFDPGHASTKSVDVTNLRAVMKRTKTQRSRVRKRLFIIIKGLVVVDTGRKKTSLSNQQLLNSAYRRLDIINYTDPDTINYVEPYIINYAEPDTINYAEPDTINYAGSDTINYVEPDIINYAEPDTINYADPDIINYAEPDIINYADHDIINYAEPAIINYAEPVLSWDCFFPYERNISGEEYYVKG
uniref:Uncharacterized protein n=1 Tax=Timema poppense TaxID=170557 RepID=A0A7R9D3S4_TIMPO|nr:unnamed protein product [Timema poppensis]